MMSTSVTGRVGARVGAWVGGWRWSGQWSHGLLWEVRLGQTLQGRGRGASGRQVLCLQGRQARGSWAVGREKQGWWGGGQRDHAGQTGPGQESRGQGRARRLSLRPQARRLCRRCRGLAVGETREALVRGPQRAGGGGISSGSVGWGPALPRGGGARTCTAGGGGRDAGSLASSVGRCPVPGRWDPASPSGSLRDSGGNTVYRQKWKTGKP